MACYPHQLLLLLALSLASSIQAIKQFNNPITVEELSQSHCYTKMLDSSQSTYYEAVINYPEQFIISLPNAQILSNKGVVITADNRPFYDYLLEYNTDRPDNPNWKVVPAKESLNFSFPDQPQQVNETIAVLASAGEDCYYHWIFEIIPRIKLLQMSGISCDKIYIGTNTRRFKTETLNKCGFTNNQIIYSTDNTLLKANTVIIPSMPHIITGSCPAWTCDSVRSLFFDSTHTETALPRKKLYITRAKPSWNKQERRIINEPEVFSYLENLGFEKVTLENLSIEEQARLFNSAEIIVAAHGAGLTNLVFCNSKLPVAVIEIYQPEWIVRCYTRLTAVLNQKRNFQFNHICIMTSDKKLSTQNRWAHNIYLELDDLKKALHSLSELDIYT